MSEIRFESTFSAKPEHLYEAFKNEAMLNTWIANDCKVDLRVNGHYNFFWTSGWFAAGVYSAVETGKHLAFSWYGRGDPGETEVDVTFAAEGDGTRLTLVHRGFGDDAAGKDSESGYQKNWDEALSNLAYYFETGLDQRLMKRPMMGVYPQDLDDTLRKQHNLTLPHGVFLNQVIEGGGAANSGLKAHDVIVKADGTDIRAFYDMARVLDAHKAGDTVPVEIWRGGEKQTVELTFGQRPIPEVPATHAALIAAMKEKLGAIMGEMDALLDGVPESVRGQKPGENEWSVINQLAHLIVSERAITTYLWMNVHGAATYPYGQNDPLHLAVGAANRGDSESMLAELRQVLDEHIAAAEALPAEAIENRGLFLTLSANLAFSGDHIRGHIRQMGEAIESAKIPA